MVPQPDFEGHVREGAIAVIAQERVRVSSLAGHPSAPQNQDVRISIVVVIGLDHVQATKQSFEPCLARVLGEAAILVVDEQSNLAGRIESRDEQIQVTIRVEVLGDDATSKAERVDRRSRGDVSESGERLLGRELVGRDQIFGRDFIGIGVNGHIGDVEQPQGGIIGIRPLLGVLQALLEILDGLSCRFLLDVDPAAPKGQKAGIGRVSKTAIPCLSQSQISHAESKEKSGNPLGRYLLSRLREQTVGLGEVMDSILLATYGLLRLPQFQVELPAD